MGIISKTTDNEVIGKSEVDLYASYGQGKFAKKINN